MPRNGVALTTLALVACTSTSTTGGAPSATSPRDDDAPPPVEIGDPRPCGPDGPRHHAFLAQGTCSDVPGEGGRWIARPLFPDAPEEIRSRACTYRWSSLDTTPDTSALAALETELLTPSCEPTTTELAPRGFVAPAPPSDASIGAPTGVSGCDVCARLAGKHVWLILPADKLAWRRLVVETQAGSAVPFDLTPPSETAQAFSVELPPAPNGTAWVDGHAKLYDATTF